MNERKAKIIIVGLYVFCFIACAIELVAALNDWASLSDFRATWTAVFFILFWHWIYYESSMQDFDRPYNFGLSINSLWYIYVPWYFISTRGARGIGTMFGFLLLFSAPFIIGTLVR